VATGPHFLVDSVGVRAGWRAGELTTRVFRHTWTAARLQTLDRGTPVSVYTVARELGHGSEEMVRRVYAAHAAVYWFVGLGRVGRRVQCTTSRTVGLSMPKPSG
jgi:hypothetical protein